MFKFRNIDWTIDLGSRNWSVPPVTAIVKKDYVVLRFAPTKWTREALPIDLVIQNQCLDCNGNKMYSFWATATRTSRRGGKTFKFDGANYVSRKRSVRSTSSYLFHARLIYRELFSNVIATGEFYALVSGILTSIPGSGYFFDLIARWTTRPEIIWYQSDTNYDPVFDESIMLPTVYGDGYTTIDDALECVNTCLLASANDTSPIVFENGVPKHILSYKPPNVDCSIIPFIGRNYSLDLPTYTSISDPNLLSYSIAQARASLLSIPLFSGSNPVEVPSKRVTSINRLTFYMVVNYTSEIRKFGICGDSEVCTISYDLKPIYRFDVLQCNAATDCDGLPAGWYIRVCIEWEFPIGTYNSLCNTVRISGPLGLPFEDSSLWVNLINLVLSKLLDIANRLIYEALQRVIDALPPNLRIVGRILYFVLDQTNARITGEVFFCPGPAVGGVSSPAIQCDDSSLPTVIPRP